MDKENQSQLGVIHRSRAAGLATGPVGKTFQSNESRIPIANTPRKALGDVNSLDLVQAIVRKGLGKLDSNIKQKGLQSRNPQKQSHQFLKPSAPASKPPKLKSNKPKTSLSEFITPEARVPSVHDDVECMHNSPVTDDFDDIWPAEERPATYLKEFLDWRPSQIGGYKYTEDDPIEFDSDDDYIPIESSIFSSGEPLSREPVDLKPEDFMLPPLQDAFEENCDLFSSLSLQ